MQRSSPYHDKSCPRSRRSQIALRSTLEGGMKSPSGQGPTKIVGSRWLAASVTDSDVHPLRAKRSIDSRRPQVSRACKVFDAIRTMRAARHDVRRYSTTVRLVNLTTMRLTIIAPDNVYELEVDPSMTVLDIAALVEAEAGVPADSQILTTDDGVTLGDSAKTLEGYGLSKESGTLFLTQKLSQSLASTSRLPTAQPSQAEADVERMRLQALGDPELMNQLRQTQPQFADVIQNDPKKFREMLADMGRQQAGVEQEKNRQVEALNADPYDIEAQKKIEEAIRMEAVLENMAHAMEYSPESFGNVTMLYINVEVNGHKVKAFVDSGAQTTIISPHCAEECGIMRLLDKRFAGMAEGVGTAKILGRIHSAQIKLGDLHLPVAFSVLEGKAVDLLFGLDMLKRHQACIDLSTNTLRIQGRDIPFLSEHELPDKARRREEAAVANDLASASRSAPESASGAKRKFPGEGMSLGSAPAAPAAPAVKSSAPEASIFPEADIATLVGLGASRQHAIQLLEAAGGNVEGAASFLF